MNDSLMLLAFFSGRINAVSTQTARTRILMRTGFCLSDNSLNLELKRCRKLSECS